MKPFTYTTIVILLLCGCRVARDRSIGQQRHGQVESSRLFTYTALADSSTRLWHFCTDSFFYYHPEYGLYGRGGLLSVSEELVRRATRQRQQDSIAYDLQEHSEEHYLARPVPLWRRSGVVVAVMIGLVFALSCVQKLRKKQRS